MIVNSSYDLEYLQIGVEEIENYLLSDELFWPVTGRPSEGRPFFLKMTIGNLLLSEHRLATLAAERLLSLPEENGFLRLRREFEVVRSKWQVAWESKANREYQARFKQWARTLEELKSDRYHNSPYYRNEVRLRVLLELLEDQVSMKGSENLQVLDSMLKRMFKSGVFIWQEELAPGFPADKYWYLYGSVSS